MQDIATQRRTLAPHLCPIPNPTLPPRVDFLAHGGQAGAASTAAGRGEGGNGKEKLILGGAMLAGEGGFRWDCRGLQPGCLC